MFGSESFIGHYQLVKNKIIFLNKPYDNDFIPDTLTIINDKLVMEVDSSGNPILSYGNYFSIEQNKLNLNKPKFKNR